MSSFEWLELEALALDMAELEKRRAEALAGCNIELARSIERQIANAHSRRAQLIEALSLHAASVAVGTAGGAAGMAAERETAAEIATEDRGLPQAGATCPEITAQTAGGDEGAVSSDGASLADCIRPTRQGRPTHADIERAKQDFDRRRAEVLARHAAELKALDAERAEIDALAVALEGFTRNVQPWPEGAEAAALDEEREPRLHG